MAMFDIDGKPVASGYDVSGRPLAVAYDVDGKALTTAVDYETYSISELLSVTIKNTQGFDIFNGVIFQFRAGTSVSDLMTTVSVQNKAIIQSNIAVESDHGDSVSFSDEYYEEGDAFPLLYVTSDTSPALVYVNRVTERSATLIRTLSFPLDKTGYYAAHAYDCDNRIMYMVGYSQNNALTDDGGNNKMIVSKWDMSQLTENQDESFTPQFIGSFNRDFIYVAQGQQFHDGMIWISSGYTGGVNSYIYAINKNTGALLFTIDLNTTSEVEGMSFISPTEMVVGFQGGAYKMVTFGESE